MPTPSIDSQALPRTVQLDGEDVLVALATYNERANLPRLVPEILRILPQAGLLIVDDNSPDGTGTWADDLKVSEPRIEVIHRRGKEGLGTAYLAAMRFAKENQFHWLVTMDADGSHSPQALPALLKRASGSPPCDLVIGSRYVPGGIIENWPWTRRLTSSTLNAVLRSQLPVGIRDYTSGFRCYRVSFLSDDILRPPASTGFGFLEELIVRVEDAGGVFAEVPITFSNRTRGTSKATWRECWTAAAGLLRLLRARRRAQQRVEITDRSR